MQTECKGTVKIAFFRRSKICSVDLQPPEKLEDYKNHVSRCKGEKNCGPWNDPSVPLTKSVTRLQAAPPTLVGSYNLYI